MDPIDALVLKAIHENSRETWKSPASHAIASKFQCSTDEIIVSIEHLAELNCIHPNLDRPHTKPFGTLLMNVVSD
jgi:hypothetical protein